MRNAQHLYAIQSGATGCNGDDEEWHGGFRPDPCTLQVVFDLHKKFKQPGAQVAPLEKAILYQHLSRHWRNYLTLAEVSVAYYVLDRSIGWGKPHFVASSANVLYGDDKYSGVGLPERTYFRTLRTMQDKGFLFRKPFKWGTKIGLNLLWCPWDHEEDWPSGVSDRDCQTGKDPCHTGSQHSQSGRRALPVRQTEYGSSEYESG